MATVLICGVVSSGVLLGLVGGLVVGIARARGAILTALASDPAVVVPRRRAVFA